MPADPDPNEPVLLGGSARPDEWFRRLFAFAGVRPKIDVESGEERPWLLKTCERHAQPNMTHICLSRRSISWGIPLVAQHFVTTHIEIRWRSKPLGRFRSLRRSPASQRRLTENVPAADRGSRRRRELGDVAGVRSGPSSTHASGEKSQAEQIFWYKAKQEFSNR